MSVAGNPTGATWGCEADGSGLDDVVEERRMAAVLRHRILDTPPDGTFDRITAVAARFFGVPIAIVSIVDRDRIWFKSHHGLPEVAEVGRDPGLCASAVLHEGPWIVSDAVADPRALANPLVAGQLGLRFYAGMPLTTSDGFNLGTLCVIDRKPRLVTDEELEVLRDLASMVVGELELRIAARTTVETETRLRRQAEELANALQASLLPPRPPSLPGLELATRYRAATWDLQVGGDFYDVFRLGADGWGVVVGDVCGKGARAAALTALARWTIRAVAAHNSLPSSILAELNAALLADADPEVDDHFCSAVFAQVEICTGVSRVTLASAGHPRPIVVRRAGWIDVRGHVGLPLGMFADATPTDDRVELGPGDALVLLTDGITEARNAGGELFGDETLPELLLDCCGLAAEAVADRLLDAATGFSAGDLRDDVAIVVIRVPEDAMAEPAPRFGIAAGGSTDAVGSQAVVPGDVETTPP